MLNQQLNESDIVPPHALPWGDAAPSGVGSYVKSVPEWLQIDVAAPGA